MKIQLLAGFLALGLAPTAYASSFQNGSFETSTVSPAPGWYLTLNQGNASAITGWIVGAGGIDYIGTFWGASNGSRSLDLVAASGVGGIAQTFDTAIGAHYQVAFDLAGNYYEDPVKLLNVSIQSGSIVNQSFVFNTSGKSANNMGWTRYAMDFVAGSGQTTLAFTGSSQGSACCYGPALDNVTVALTAAVPEAETYAMFLAGLGLMAGIARRRKKPEIAA
jgi:choice-of-anchor C domain-containing protein